MIAEHDIREDISRVKYVEDGEKFRDAFEELTGKISRLAETWGGTFTFSSELIEQEAADKG